MNNEIIKIIETSFFSHLLKNEDITDIYFNGTSMFYLTTSKGRNYDKNYPKDQISQFVRQIANLTNKLFSYQNPYLDVSIGKYRLSAVHELLSKDEQGHAISFALRIANNDKDLLEKNNFFNLKTKKAIKQILLSNQSILIIGATGSGKTQLQKYLIGQLEPATRLVVIDNGLELVSLKSYYPSLDITMWEYDEIKDDRQISSLIKIALRFNIDYLIIAESRGRELTLMYEASLTGHPTILTLHASEVELIYDRMSSMVNYVINKDQFSMTFPYVILLEKKIVKQHVIRKIKSICFFEHKLKKFTYLYNDEE